MKFNSRRYRQLIIRNWDQLNPQEKTELRLYDLLIEHEIFWNDRNEYIQIINDCINLKIDVDEFEMKFRLLRRKNMDLTSDLGNFLTSYLVKNQKNFELTFDEKGFVSLVDNIFTLVDSYDSDLEGFELNNYRVSAEGLKYYLQKYSIPEINEYTNRQKAYSNSPVKDYQRLINENSCQDTPKIYKDTEVLSFTMGFFTILTSLLYSLLNPEFFHLLSQ